MTDTHQDTDNIHPEELLAVYVDGTASDEERRTVEGHLAACERCRSEVQLATSARAALVSLPELAAPGPAAAGLDAFRQSNVQHSPDASTTDLAAAREGRERRRIHWDRLALGAGLAAAAGLFIIFAVIGLTNHGRPSAGPSSASLGAAGLPPVIDHGASYSQVSLQALASRLEAPARAGKTVGAPNREGAATPAANPAFGTNTPPDQTAVLSCLQAAAGLGPTAKPIYLEAADFQGTPAFVGAFVTPPVTSGGSSHLLVVAASRNSCQPLYVVRQSL